MIDSLELADDIQPDIRELVLEQVQEERQQMLNCCFFAEKRCQPGDLGCDRRANVLGAVLAQITDAWDDALENDLLLDRFRET